MAGFSRTELLDWLLGEWREQGPPVLLVEGFSGVGKSPLGRDLLNAWADPRGFVSIPEGGEDVESLLFDIAATFETRGYPAIADQADGDFRHGLCGDFMRSGGLLVLDDFDELFEPDSRELLPAIARLLSDLSTSQGSARALLLSSTSPDSDGWIPSVPIKTLAPPGLQEAELLLTGLLKDRGLEDEIPEERLGDVTQWLGRNPRAMQAFVTCLVESPLEELVQLDEDAWEKRQEEPSPILLRRLETLFLRKTLSRLDADSSLLLEALSVFRKPFTVDAMRSVSPPGVNTLSSKDDLTRRFILSRDRKWYSLNPIARRLANSQLRADPRKERRAHSNAGDYFFRRCTTSTTGATISAGDFIEARHHLYNSGREDDYEDLAADYRRIILQNYRHMRDLPSTPAERDMLLRTLGSIMEEDWRGYSRLRGLLATLLVERGHPRDGQRALRQITVCTRESRDLAHWTLRATLLAKYDTPLALVAMAREAQSMLASPSLAQLLVQVVNLLAERREEGRALTLLNELAESVTPEDRQPIYTAAGYLLCRTNRQEDAIGFLIDAYKQIPTSGRNRHRLFEEALFIAFQHGRRDQISLIKEMVRTDGRNELQVTLCDILEFELEGDYQGAVNCGGAPGHYFALDCQVAFSWLCMGDLDAAQRTIDASRGTFNPATSWLRGLLALCRGSSDLYVRSMVDSSPIQITPQEVTPSAWLGIWDQDPEALRPYPAFYFPVLPSSLTGLDGDLTFHLGSRVAERLDAKALHLPHADPTSTGPRAAGPGNDASVIVRINQYQEGSMGDTYNVNQAGAVGKEASAQNVVFSGGGRDNVDEVLLEQLRKLLAEMTTAGVDDAEILEADVTIVQQAIESGLVNDRKTLLSKLAGLGASTLQFARDIGVDVAAAVIQRQIGL